MTPLLDVAILIVRAWTRAYTCRLPPATRDARRAEIESDLWEFVHDPARPPGPHAAVFVLARLLAGMPDDLAWRTEQIIIGARTMRTVAAVAVATVVPLVVAGVWLQEILGPVDLPSPVAMVSAQAPPPPPPPPPPPGMVVRPPPPVDPSRIVTIDGHVRESGSGTPIVDARVVFRAERRDVPGADSFWLMRGWLDGTQEYAWRTREQATTGTGGRFTAQLEPGVYRVEVERTGFVQSAPAMVHVRLGTRPEEVRVDLVRASVMTGWVVDENGTPVHSAIVMALRAPYRDGRRIVAPCETGVPAGAIQTTNERGEYRLFDLAPGDYYVTATVGATTVAENCRAFAWYYPGVADPADALTVTVRTGIDPAAIDIQVSDVSLHAATFETLDPPDLDGTRQPPAVVQITRRSRDGLHAGVMLDAGPSLGLLHRTGDGRYETTPLPPGSYDLYYRKYLSRAFGHLAFDIVDRDVDAGTMAFHPLVPVRGTIRGTADVALDAEGLFVALKPLGPWSRLLSIAYTSPLRPDASGGFATGEARGGVGGVPEGRYRAGVFGLPPDAYVASVRYDGAEVRETGFAVSAATADRRLEILIGAPGGIVEGEVLDARREPVAYGRVVLVPEADPHERPDLFRVATTDETGLFSIRGVPPGAYELLAWDDVEDGAWEDPAFLRQVRSHAERIRVDRGSHQRVAVRVIPPAS